MNGKDILQALSYVDPKYIEEAETLAFPERHRRLSLRRPILVAALVAMMLLLVGCAVVYVLKMQDLKLGERTSVVYEVDGDSNIVGETVEVQQQVLTLVGLEGSPAHMAAKEWYDFKQEYDPDHLLEVKLIQENAVPEFPAEYEAYDIYTQEMKDKLDEIVEKYALKLMGPCVSYRTTKQLCRALGMERVLKMGSEANMEISTGTYYKCGNLTLGYDVSLPAVGEEAAIDTWGQIFYRRKDTFCEDVKVIGEGALIGENYGVKEWNYTTTSGDEVLIVRSSSDWRAWLFCEQPEYMVSIVAEARFESYSDDADGNTIIESVEMTDRQLELLAENMDFSVKPQLDTSVDITGGAVGSGESIDGYTVELKSAVTDGYVGYVTLGITAPEGVVLLNQEQDASFQMNVGRCDLQQVNGTDKGVNTILRTKAEEDGDALDNTCDIVISLEENWEEGTAPFAVGQTWNIYLEDLVSREWDTEVLDYVVETLSEGTWTFDLTFEGDQQALELITEPVTVETTRGQLMDRSYDYFDVEVESFVLRSRSASISFADDIWAEFVTSDHHIYVVMKDGSRVEMTGSTWAAGQRDLKAEAPIDLDQVDYVLLADGTKLMVADTKE